MNKSTNTEYIKYQANQLGFSIGISKAEYLEDQAPKLEKWLSQNYHASMSYMENHFDKRLNPTLLVDGTKSVISLTYNYYSAELQVFDAPKISKYAYGEDYHHVIKNKLKQLLTLIEEKIGKVNARIFTDSAPIMERAWAVRSGLGWIGKNGNLIDKTKGSFYFLAEIMIDLELDYDTVYAYDHCGACSRCISICPTDAILPGKVIDANKCISYLTIEHKDSISSAFSGKLDGWMFGCDACQDVCPWNKRSTPNTEHLFVPKEQLLSMTRSEWIEITGEIFEELFEKSAVKRTKFNGLTRNIKFLYE